MKPNSCRLPAFVLAALILTAHPVAGHDSWLIADRSALDAPGEVRMAFVTSEHFPVSEHATQADRVQDWTVHQRGLAQAVSGHAIEGHELSARTVLTGPGVHVLAIALKPRFIEIEPDKFDAYLRSEAAAAALEQRGRSGESDLPGREYYTKCSKTFVEVAGQESPDFGAAAGHTLEIIPLSNPCRWRRGGSAEVRVVYKGAPSAGVQVCAGHEPPPEAAGGAAQRVRGGNAPAVASSAQGGHHYAECRSTGPDGTVRFNLPHEGLWFLRTHRIERLTGKLPAGLMEPADWQSHWASITFRVLPQAP